MGDVTELIVLARDGDALATDRLFAQVYRDLHQLAARQLGRGKQDMGTTSLVQSAALDKYSFTRDAYLQLRENATRAGDEEDETQWMNESAAEPAPQGSGK